MEIGSKRHRTESEVACKLESEHRDIWSDGISDEPSSTTCVPGEGKLFSFVYQKQLLCVKALKDHIPFDPFY